MAPDQPIKILYVIDTYVFGGAEKGLLSLIQNIDRSSYQVALVCPEKNHLAEIIKKENIDHFNFKKLRFRNIIQLISSILLLIKIIKKHNIDIIHSQTPTSNLVSNIAAKWAKIKSVNHCRTFLLEGMVDFDRIFLRLSDKIICNTNAIKERFHKKDLENNKVKTIYNGVDIKQYSPESKNTDLEKELGLNLPCRKIGSFNRLEKDKGLLDIISAIPGVVSEFPDVMFYFVAGCLDEKSLQLKKEMEDLAENLKVLNFVKFTGFQKDIPAIVNLMDLTIMSSYSEPSGRVLFESQSCGVPVIATNTGGTPEIVIDGRTGLLIPPRSPEKIAAAVIELLKNNKKRKEIGEDARQHIINNFSIEQHVNNICSVYREITWK